MVEAIGTEEVASSVATDVFVSAARIFGHRGANV